MIMIMVGELKAASEYKLERITESYKPFMEELVTPETLLKRYKEYKEPLFANKGLLILKFNFKYVQLLNLSETLKKVNNEYADVIIVAKMLDKFIKNPIQGIEVKYLSETVREDFREYAFNTICNLSENGYKEIIKRIGYSSDKLKKFSLKLNQNPIVTDKEVKEVIKQRHLKGLEQILFDITNRSRNGYRDYRELCDRYSEQWVNNQFIDILDNTINYKKMILSGQVINGTKDNDRFKYYKLVEMTNITNIVKLRSLLKYKIAPIEIYYKVR